MGTDSSLPRINIHTISEAAYEVLRERVISKEFAPGQRLNLEAIEKQLGISRTPLKEALTRLEMEGLVTIVPRTGTYVTDPVPEEIAESFDMRRVLEVYAVELAVQRASDEDYESLAHDGPGAKRPDRCKRSRCHLSSLSELRPSISSATCRPRRQPAPLPNPRSRERARADGSDTLSALGAGA